MIRLEVPGRQRDGTRWRTTRKARRTLEPGLYDGLVVDVVPNYRWITDGTYARCVHETELELVDGGEPPAS